MAHAIDLAVASARSGGGPFAALVVKDGEIIGSGANRVTAGLDPTAHAEIVAIREACERLHDFRLTGCDLYATCEPCPMCLGAIYWARIGRVFFAASHQDAAAAGFDDALIYHDLAKPLKERRIPMVPLLVEQGQRAFDAWRSNPQKQAY